MADKPRTRPTPPPSPQPPPAERRRHEARLPRDDDELDRYTDELLGDLLAPPSRRRQ